MSVDTLFGIAMCVAIAFLLGMVVGVMIERGDL